MKETFRKLVPIALLSLLAACQQVTIIVDGLPENTPANSPIYIMGEFNYWDPGDGRYLLKANEMGDYMVTLPRGFGTMEYRFTRGSLESIEADLCAREMKMRKVELNYTDTVRNEIYSWKDLGPTNCGQLTIVLDELPANTPRESEIFLASNWNDWAAADSNYQFLRNAQGKYAITLPKKAEKVSFKLTRGTWATGEVDAFGKPISNRTYAFGKQDTIKIKVANWDDRVSPNAQYLTLMVDELPLNTPQDFELYMASNLNNWKAEDQLFAFKQQADGRYYLRIKHTSIDTLLFKITRGDWNKVEGDDIGMKINNRKFIFVTADTLSIRIQSWEDLENK